MRQCPSLQQWLDLAEGRLESEEVVRLEAHQASGCAACGAQWSWVQRIRAALPGSEGLRFSADRRRYLRELAAARLAPRPHRLWIARLLLDTRQQPTLAGARGEGDSIQLRYETEEGEIRLWGEFDSHDGWYLIGQVLSKGENRFLAPEGATLTAPAGDILYTARGEDTEVHFAGVRAGDYHLEIRLPESVLLIPALTLGEG